MCCVAQEGQVGSAGVAAAQYRDWREEIPHVQDQGQPPKGDNPRPRSGAVAKEHLMQRCVQ